MDSPSLRLAGSHMKSVGTRMKANLEPSIQSDTNGESQNISACAYALLERRVHSAINKAMAHSNTKF
jgi:hypothetical protein